MPGLIKLNSLENSGETNFAEAFIERFFNKKMKTGLCRPLLAEEIKILEDNHNRAHNWSDLYVSNDFNAHLIHQCEFWGKIFIGDLSEQFLEYDGIRLPVGLYNSTIFSSIINNNVAIRNVRYLSNYIVEKQCLLFNIDEMYTTAQATFGHGFVKNGQDEERIWLEVINEAGGRSILPFRDMLTADAYLWASFRGDKILQERFIQLTDKLFNKEDFTLGLIGKNSVLIDNRIIQNTICGTNCVIKGTNKLENLTIQSSAEEQTFIGIGSELKDGIVGYQNKIEYDVKAIRFVTGRNVHLEYGVRFINSFVGPNSTIACCEVLSNLIYPFHEQRHNNSFLIASLVMGQANIAAGATIGSNHNSRAADGEIFARRGFWPGLVTNFKHNSSFASFTIFAKGNYYAELNITLPFCLVSPTNDMNTIQLFPGFWFKYNMYALARNAWKFEKRDKRKIKAQHIETDFLAPDTIEEIFLGIKTLHEALQDAVGRPLSFEEIEQDAAKIDKEVKVYLKNQMNKGKAFVIKPAQGIHLYRMMIKFYSAKALYEILNKHIDKNPAMDQALQKIKKDFRNPDNRWENIGGQIISKAELKGLLEKIKSKAIDSWESVHEFYDAAWERYPEIKQMHGLSSLLRLEGIKIDDLNEDLITEILSGSKKIAGQLLLWAHESREKDYHSTFRKITYRSTQEMEAVTGRIEDNSFLIDYKKSMETYIRDIETLLSKLG